MLQSDSGTNALHDLIGNFVCPLSATREDIVNVRFVSEDFFPALAHRRQIIPELLEKLLFEIAIANAAFLKLFPYSLDFIF